MTDSTASGPSSGLQHQAVGVAQAARSDRYASLKVRVRTALMLSVPVIASITWASYSSIGKMIFLGLWLIALLISAFEFARCCSVPPPEGSVPIGEYLVRRWGYSVCLGIAPFLTALAALVPLGDQAISIATGSESVARPDLVIGALIFGVAIAQGLAVALLVRASTNSLEEGGLIARELFSGVLLVGFGGSSVIAVLALPLGCLPLLWLLLTVIATDVGAYFAGQRFGGPPLTRLISPKKTRSGSLGGLALTVVVGVVSSILFVPTLPLGWAVVLSIATSALAQTGDLSKSFVKRIHRQKDMGTILPGHGGILDRIDGVLAAAPLALAFVLVGWLV